jgi:hypothetical protein
MIFVISSANAQDIDTLEAWDVKTKNWTSDPSEITYMLGRCASAFLAMSAYMSQSSKQEAITNANIIKGRALQYAELSLEIGKSVGITEKFLDTRIKTILNIYVADMLKSKTLTNNAFGENFTKDIDFCSVYYPIFFNNSKK